MNDKEFLKTWRTSGREELAAQITPESVNEELRSVDICWFTGIDVSRYDWWNDAEYMLSFDPKGADLSILNARAPVCDNHSMYSVDDQKGVVLKAWEKKGSYLATIQLKRSTPATGPRPEIDGLWQDIKDGIVSKFSMGVELLETVDTRDKNDKLVNRTATKWRPFEISIAPIPADNGTTTLSKSTILPPNFATTLAFRQREVEVLRLR